MRDEKRRESILLEEAYKKVNEMSLSPAGPASGSAAAAQSGPLIASAGDEEMCGDDISTDITAVAVQAIAAITELAVAAGANISVAVDIGEQEVEEVELIDQFNTGYEDVEDT